MSLPAAAEDFWAYFGTYTRKGGEGIYVSRFDNSKGTLGEPALAAKLENPSFVAIHPNRKFLYAVSETENGTVTAYAIDLKKGTLKALNSMTTKGSAPCHLNVDASGKMLVVANYSSGSVAAYTLTKDGRLGEMSSFIEHEGSSVNPRQTSPHAHSVNFSANNQFVVAADLGIDQVIVYRADPMKATLERVGNAKLAPGSGPRHFVFHPNGKYAYVNNEILSTVTAFSYDAGTGALSEIHTLSTLPPGFSGNNSTAEIRAHPNGKAVYVSNRGHNTLAFYSVDAATGRLTYVKNVSTGGEIPRNFNLDPSGRFLLAANQESDNVVLLRVDLETGEPTPAGQSVHVSMPVCVRFVPIK